MAVLSWFSGSFPNALCEATACGVPCIVTVCDYAQIGGDTGNLVRPGEPVGLAEANLELIQQKPINRRPGLLARERIVAMYGLGPMVAQTERLLPQAVANKDGSD